jgi:hypothetical protein
VLGVCARMSLRRLEGRSASEFVGWCVFFYPRSWGQVLSPPIGGFALVNIMLGFLSF